MRWMKIIIFTSIFLLLSDYLNAADLLLINKDGSVISRMTEGTVYASLSTTPVFDIQVNLLLDPKDKSTKGIKYACKCSEELERLDASAMMPPKTKSVYYIDNGLVFGPGENPEFYPGLIYILPVKAGLAFYSASTDQLLAYFNGNPRSCPQIFAAIHLIDRAYQLTEKKLQKDSIKTEARIYKLWDTHENTFTWDGEVLRKCFGSESESWTFDGEILQPLWNTDPSLEYKWDCKSIKPAWAIGSNEEYVWRGSILEPMWGDGPRYIYKGEMIRQEFAVTESNDWVIEGDIPLPVIAIVVLGIIEQ